MTQKYNKIDIYCYECHSPLEGEWGIEQFTGNEYGWIYCANCHWQSSKVKEVLEIRQIALDEMLR